MADELKKLADEGKWHELYGVDDCLFKLDDTIYEAKEDESDGYRSYLESIEIVRPENAIFFANPVAAVKVVEIVDTTDDADDGYRLVDADGHVWLTIGTDHSEDYYPSFRFVWTPKAATNG